MNFTRQTNFAEQIGSEHERTVQYRHENGSGAGEITIDFLSHTRCLTFNLI